MEQNINTTVITSLSDIEICCGKKVAKSAIYCPLCGARVRKLAEVELTQDVEDSIPNTPIEDLDIKSLDADKLSRLNILLPLVERIKAKVSNTDEPRVKAVKEMAQDAVKIVQGTGRVACLLGSKAWDKAKDIKDAVDPCVPVVEGAIAGTIHGAARFFGTLISETPRMVVKAAKEGHASAKSTYHGVADNMGIGIEAAVMAVQMMSDEDLIKLAEKQQQILNSKKSD